MEYPPIKVRIGEVNLVKFLKLKGRLVSLVFIETRRAINNIRRDIFFVPGNAKELNLDEIEEKEISKLYYVMNTKERRGDIDGVSTNPQFERFGLSKSLFAFAFRDMKAHKIKDVFLIWDGHDERTRILYESLGFRFIKAEKTEMVVSLDSAVVHSLCVKSWWPGKT